MLYLLFNRGGYASSKARTHDASVLLAVQCKAVFPSMSTATRSHSAKQCEGGRSKMIEELVAWRGKKRRGIET